MVPGGGGDGGGDIEDGVGSQVDTAFDVQVTAGKSVGAAPGIGIFGKNPAAGTFAGTIGVDPGAGGQAVYEALVLIDGRSIGDGDIIISAVKAQGGVEFTSGTVIPHFGAGAGSAGAHGGVAGSPRSDGAVQANVVAIGVGGEVVGSGAGALIELVPDFGSAAVVVVGDLGRGASVVVDAHVVDVAVEGILGAGVTSSSSTGFSDTDTDGIGERTHTGEGAGSVVGLDYAIDVNDGIGGAGSIQYRGHVVP